MTEAQLRQKLIAYKAGRLTLTDAIKGVEEYSSARNSIKMFVSRLFCRHKRRYTMYRRYYCPDCERIFG